MSAPRHTVPIGRRSAKERRALRASLAADRALRFAWLALDCGVWRQVWPDPDRPGLWWCPASDGGDLYALTVRDSVVTHCSCREGRRPGWCLHVFAVAWELERQWWEAEGLVADWSQLRTEQDVRAVLPQLVQRVAPEQTRQREAA